MYVTRYASATVQLIAFAAIVWLAAPPARAQRAPSQSRQGGDRNLTTLSIDVRAADGSPIDLNCIVYLRTFTGATAATGSPRGGIVEFNDLSPGRYTLDVTAPGYQQASENIDAAPGGHQQVLITLNPEANAAVAQPPGYAVLAPKAQKEFNQALEAIRINRFKDARKHMDKVSRLAPANPDVNFLWGMYWAEAGDWGQAKAYWEKAVQIYPRHSSALAALGQRSLNTGDVSAAIAYLQRAVEASPSSWRFQERLAEAYLLHQEPEQAAKCARRAIAIGKDRALQAEVVLTQALAQLHTEPAGTQALDDLPVRTPSQAQVTTTPPLVARPASAIMQPDASAPSPALMTTVPTSKEASAKSLAAELAPPPMWMPPDVDEQMPPVDSNVPCPLSSIREETGKRVREFIDAVNRISATEFLEDDVIDRSGLPATHVARKYSYVATVEELHPGAFNIDEYRNGTLDLGIFPGHIATIGLSSLVMIFHPIYQDDYEISCEGLSHSVGSKAWQIHFRQEPTKPARLREYRVGTGIFPVSLRGRAWIATDTYQVLKIETDLVAPVRQIALKAEHTVVTYQPVAFRTRGEKLWLPQNAELFFDLNRHRLHRRHHFGDYQLFAVDEKEHMSAPANSGEAYSKSP